MNIHRDKVTEPEANICFSTIFRGEYLGLQNNGIKLNKNTDVILRMHRYTYVCCRSFDSKLTCTLIGNKTSNEKPRNRNSSFSFVLSLLTSLTVVSSSGNDYL